MPVLDFYGAQVPYEGQPLGMFLPNEKAMVGMAAWAPKYVQMDPVRLAAAAGTHDRADFEANLRNHLSWVRLEREGFNPFLSGGDHDNPVHTETLKEISAEQQVGLANTEQFLGEVLTALDGQ